MGWIETSERLPGVCDVVLVVFDGEFALAWLNPGGEWLAAADAAELPAPTHWRPLPPPPGDEGETVEVRIAVSVSPDGNWGAAGGSGLDHLDALGHCGHDRGDRLCWVTARVPLPRVVGVAGEVEG